jgi:hypothetical protein
VEQAATYGTRCDGCAQAAFELRTINGAKLCGSCAEKSARIDRRLASTRTEDPVFCDGCEDRVEFDARVAVLARECGGGVLCVRCKPTEIARGSS